MKKLLFSTLFFAALLNQVFAITDICDISVGPDSKVANYAHNQDVTVTMGYSTDEATGVRIYARPYSGGSLSSGYTASGSGLYTGSGTATSSFTITSGTVIVDEIRIEVYASDNSTLLRRMWVPVRFRFGNVGVNHFKFTSSTELSSFLLGEDFTCSFQYAISYPGGVRVFIRPFTNGALTPGYSASGSGIYTGSGNNGGGSFTINSGKNVHVDAVRVKIVNADQSVDIDEFFIPVNLYFSTVKITNITAQPGNFPFNNDTREISYNYATTEPSGVRIFPRPWTNGNLTPAYSASGSGVYTGSGSASGTFSITSGNQRVDHVRFNVTNHDQTETLLQIWSPVEYTFGNFLVEDIQLCPASPVRLEHDEPVNIHFAYFNDEGQDTRIFVRPFTGGALSPGYGASGSPSYPSGSGEASSSFSISSGNVVVDQLRFQITNASQSAILAEYFIPVRYVFGGQTTAVVEQSSYLSEMTVSPNPVVDEARVSITLKESATVQVYVVDISGRIVADWGTRDAVAEVPTYFSLQANTLPSGTYFVVASGDNFKQTQKLMVLK